MLHTSMVWVSGFGSKDLGLCILISRFGSPYNYYCLVTIIANRDYVIMYTVIPSLVSR